MTVFTERKGATKQPVAEIGDKPPCAGFTIGGNLFPYLHFILYTPRATIRLAENLPTAKRFNSGH